VHNKTQNVYCAAPRFVGQHQTHLGWAKRRVMERKRKKEASNTFVLPQCLQSQLWAHMMLKHLHQCSVCDPAQYNWMKKKSNMCWFGSRKWFRLRINARVGPCCAPAEKSVINMI
jgi:hypothetical protein